MAGARELTRKKWFAWRPVRVFEKHWSLEPTANSTWRPVAVFRKRWIWLSTVDRIRLESWAGGSGELYCQFTRYSQGGVIGEFDFNTQDL